MRKVVFLVISVFTLMCLLSGCVQSNNYQQVSFDKDKITSSVLSSNSEFAFDIFSRLNEEDKDKSIFISPLSISTALSMTMQGAGTTTREGMMKALKYEGIDLEEVNESYKNLLRYMDGVDKKVELDINNSIWIRKGKNIKDDFISVNKDVFNAYVTDLDFSKDDSADKINKWIANSTKNKIEKMIDAPISSDIIMYLINAIYFKGEWTHQFDKKLTFGTKFNTGDGDAKDVMMMSRKGEVEYGDKGDFKVVRLPYGKGKTSMYCVLPNEGVSINDFIKGLNEEKWKEIKESVSKTEDVLLNIPRFKMEYGIKALNNSLISMGMGEAFSAKADFSGISNGVSISRVLHKAVIEVNEEGSEAAGVTVVEMKETAFMGDPPSFIANRPFVFFITKDTMGTILFMGKLYDV